MFDMIDAATTPAVNALHSWAPAGAMFFIGLLLLLVSVRMIDKCLPEAASQTEHLEDHADWRSRPWIMFGVGSAVALITMSVSVALTVLVPVVAKGYFRRRHAIPYILGANIATLGDTLLTSLALGNGVAVQIVLAELISILIVTALLLSLFYRPLTELLLRVTDGILASRGRLIGFCTALFAIPLTLILFV
jgi:sodium-dependent phosphate cotransporter